MRKLTVAELTTETVELLPARETLFGDLNIAGVYATNLSAAANVVTAFSSANSLAVQGIVVMQG